MDKIDELLAKEEICQLKARYCQTLDTKKWDEMAALFAEGFTAESTSMVEQDVDWGMRVEGGQAWVDRTRDDLGTRASYHRATMPQIEILGPSSAKCVWTANFGVIGNPDDQFKSLDGLGFYNETYERVDNRWLMKSLLLEIYSIKTAQ